MLNEKFKILLDATVTKCDGDDCEIEIAIGNRSVYITLTEKELKTLKERGQAVESVLILDTIRRGKV